MNVGVDGVVALFLQLVCRNLGHESDAPAFLVQIEDDSLAFFLDASHGGMELFSAVAAFAAEDVAGGTTRVYTYKDGFVLFPRAFDEGDVLQVVVLLAEGYEVEMAVCCGHIHFLAAFNQRFFLQTVGDEVLDSEDVESFAFGNLHKLWHACHRAVFVEDFDEAGSGEESAHPRKVNGSFGVSGPCQYAAVLGVEGVDVSGTSEPFGPCVGVCKGADGGGTVVGGDSGGAAFEHVDGDGEGCAEHRRVFLYLVFKAQFTATFVGDGGAQHTTAVLQHEVHLFRCNKFGGSDEVSLVLTVFVIDNDDKLSFLEVFKGLLYRADGALGHICFRVKFQVVDEYSGLGLSSSGSSGVSDGGSSVAGTCVFCSSSKM